MQTLQNVPANYNIVNVTRLQRVMGPDEQSAVVNVIRTLATPKRQWRGKYLPHVGKKQQLKKVKN